MDFPLALGTEANDLISETLAEMPLDGITEGSEQYISLMRLMDKIAHAIQKYPDSETNGVSELAKLVGIFSPALEVITAFRKEHPEPPPFESLNNRSLVESLISEFPMVYEALAAKKGLTRDEQFDALASNPARKSTSIPCPLPTPLDLHISFIFRLF